MLLKYGCIALGALLSVLIYLYTFSIPPSYSRALLLTEWYGFISLSFLYYTLLVGPLYRAFPFLPYRTYAYRLLSAFGILALYFALLHGAIGFFELFLGFAGLPYLTAIQISGMGAGLLGLLVLALLGGTSFEIFMRMLGPWWKRLHRLAYLGGVAIIAHVLIAGMHFMSLLNWVALTWTLLLIVLLGLHAYNLKPLLAAKVPVLPARAWGFVLGMLLIGILYGLYMLHAYVHGAHQHAI